MKSDEVYRKYIQIEEIITIITQIIDYKIKLVFVLDIFYIFITFLIAFFKTKLKIVI